MCHTKYDNTKIVFILSVFSTFFAEIDHDQQSAQGSMKMFSMS